MTSICSTSLLLLSAVTLTAFTSDEDTHFTLVITGEVKIIAVKAYDQFVRIEEW